MSGWDECVGRRNKDQSIRGSEQVNNDIEHK